MADSEGEYVYLDISASSNGLNTTNHVFSCPENLSRILTIEFNPIESPHCYFEIKILTLSESGIVAIGIGRQGYSLGKMPGNRPLSIAYCSDKGQIYQGSAKGKQFGPVCEAGDRMGCGIDFGRTGKDSTSATIWFSKNGELAGPPVKATKPIGGFCPLMGMLNPGGAIEYLGNSQQIPPYLEKPVLALALQIPEPESEVEVVYPYDAATDNELTLKPGDMVYVDKWHYSEFWAYGQIFGKSGLFYKGFTKNVRKMKRPLERFPTGYSASYRNIEFMTTERREEWLDCIICYQLAYEPRQTACCGHTMCNKCAQNCLSRSTHCPHCRHDPFSVIQDPRAERSLKGLTAYCKNMADGCDWKDKVPAIVDHIKIHCLFQKVNCPNLCGQKLLRRDIDEHNTTSCKLSRVVCPCCSRYILTKEGNKIFIQGKMKHTELVQSHYKVCKDWPARCPNDCNIMEHFTRASLQHHMDNECPLSEIECPCGGCCIKLKRKDVDQHLNDSSLLLAHFVGMLKDHSHLKHIVSNLAEENRQLKQKLQELERLHQVNM
jgi:hypothetical protein